MKIFASIPFIATALLCHGEEPRDDLLSFTNGDQLHGRLAGIVAGPSVLWKREDVGEAVKFSASDLRRIILSGGRPPRSLESLSHIGTSNGDRIPGVVREMDDKRVVLDTVFGGTLEFPREQVGLYAPNPLGGRTLYYGPYDPEEWFMPSSEHPEGIPAPKADEEDKIARWKHSGTAWYWQNKESGTALARKSGMPDRAMLRFDIAWKSRLSCTVAFHTDFKQPIAEQVEEGEDKGGEKKAVRAVVGRAMNANALPNLFGNGYALQLYSNYVVLHRMGFDEGGNARLDRVQTSNSALRLGDSGNATLEIRCNRLSGEILLFVNGEFVTQWSEIADDLEQGRGYAGKGDGFGFVVQAEDSPVRISEVLVAEWNGMPDAARSLQVDDADIVLLSNGTDRFSGKVTGLSEGKLHLEGRYGDFSFPLDDIAEVRFAKSRVAEAPDAATDEIKTRLYPLGRISGQPLTGDARRLRILNGAAGEIDLNLDYAAMLDFRGTESFLDDWDVEF